jgi:anti-anti-sigma factor
LTPFLVLNCQEADFFDSSAIGALVGLAKEARDAGGDLLLAALPAAIQQTLRLLRLDNFFIIFDDVAGALDADRRGGYPSPEPLPVTPAIAPGVSTIDRLLLEAPRRLDARTAAELEENWTNQVALNPDVVVDFSTTTFLTSAGLALLGRISRIAKENDGEVRVAGCSKDVHRVLNMARFNQVVSIYPDLETALREQP